MIMEQEIKQKLNKIKQGFRLFMSGPTSQSMREKGVSYKLNWGVSFSDLKVMAQEYGKDKALAIELWKENIRECQILATLIMPADEFPREIAEIWMEQVTAPEQATMLAFNLLQDVDYAPELAYQWIAADKPLYEICAYTLLGRLFQKGMTPNERGVNELIDQAITALQNDNMLVRHAAFNCMNKLGELGEEYDRIVQTILSQHLGKS